MELIERDEELDSLGTWLRWTGVRDVTPDPSELARLPASYRHALSDDWAGAATAWQALGCPYDAALALLDGDKAAVREAHAIFDWLGARPATTIAAQRLRTLGATSIPRGRRRVTRSNSALLTGRGLEILPTLTDGRNNAEIAERLYISVKTVDHHVGSILAKLGVHARRDVAASAHRVRLPLTVNKDRVSAVSIWGVFPMRRSPCGRQDLDAGVGWEQDQIAPTARRFGPAPSEAISRSWTAR